VLVCRIQEYSKTVKYPSSRPLEGLSIEFTRRCNFCCEHCYLGNPLTGSFDTGELSYEQWCTIFDQYVVENGLFITVTGGEPLLRQDFKKLWVAMKKRGFLISLFTNGSLVDKEMVNFLAQWTPREVSISLYGASEQMYQKVTGKINMFERVIRALEMFTEAGVPLEVKGVFTKLNIEDFYEVKAIGERFCDLFRWDVDLIGAFAYSGNTPQDIRLSPGECAAIEAEEPLRNQELKNRFDHWSPPAVDSPRLGPFTCGIGFHTAYIDSTGGLQPCLPLESISYDLKNGTLEDGWHRAIPEMLHNFNFHPGPCQSCDAFELCGQCVAFALLDQCSAAGPVPFKCELAKQRARIYGLSNKVKYIPE